MRDLTPVRLSGGGTLLVLTDGNGAEYAVPVASLRETLGRAGTTEVSTVRTPPPRGKEPTMDSSLRPRDIQSRIRAGESPDDVAAVAGCSVDKVMIFASPVLAERAHVAHSATSASVRRATPDPTSPAVTAVRTLGPAVETRLREEGVDPDSVTWDSWRREDGRWTLQAGYGHDAEQRLARFSYDQRGHFVSADDDEARWLVADGQVPARATVPVAAAAAPGLRLAPAYDEQPELGDDALDLVQTDPAPAPAPAAAVPSDSVYTDDADWIATVDATPPPAARPNPVVDPAAPVDEPTPQREAELVDEPTVETPRTQLPTRPATKKARGRASVPSWDEIMFGGGK